MEVEVEVEVVKVEGISCRALLDTCSSVSAERLKHIRKKPIRRETKTVDMMLNSTTRKIEASKVEKDKLLS